MSEQLIMMNGYFAVNTEEVTESGIILSTERKTADNRLLTVQYIAEGEDKLQIGDKVIVLESPCVEILFGDKKYLCLKKSSIVALIRK